MLLTSVEAFTGCRERKKPQFLMPEDVFVFVGKRKKNDLWHLRAYQG